MKTSSIFLFFFFLLIVSCNHHSDVPLKIAISKSKPIEFYGNYPNWVLKASNNAEIINMYELGVDSALKVLESCNGLIIAGGADVYPEWYGKIEDTARCGSFDRYRDTLEIELIKKAIEKDIPLLGICRGAQIINVTLGGSLIIDIPSDIGVSVQHRQEDWENCFHSVDLAGLSYLSHITQQINGNVNSNHHQAIDLLAKPLMISSKSSDGIIESIEWKNKTDHGFLIGVQWHPERLDTIYPKLSTPIIEEFINQAEQYKPM